MSGLRWELLALVVVVACGTPQGVERAMCFPNDTCNAGLVCQNKLCVNQLAAEYGTPERATATFLEALKRGDLAKARDSLVADEQDAMREAKPSPQATFTIGTAAVTGDKAEVPVTINEGTAGKDIDLVLVTRRERGGWRLAMREVRFGGIKKTNPRTSEAITNIKKIHDGASAYYYEEHNAHGSVVPAIPKQFPRSPRTAGPVPPIGTCCKEKGQKCAPNPTLWSEQTWRELNFSMEDPHYFIYEYKSSGVGTNATFSVAAYGDLDCNGVYSTFEMVGSVQADGTVVGRAGMFIDKSDE